MIKTRISSLLSYYFVIASLVSSSLAFSSPFSTSSLQVSRIQGFNGTWDDLVITQSDLILQAMEHVTHQKNYLKQQNYVSFLDKSFNVLTLRKLNPHQKSRYDALKRTTEIRQSYCTLSIGYAAEASGVLRKTVDKRAKGNEIVHVYGMATRKLFQKWQKGSKSVRFDAYIKKNATKKDLRKMRRNIVKYLSPEERKAYAITFQDGELWQNNRPLNGAYIFVLDAAGKNLYAGVKKSGYIQHSSFVAGEPVQCAGWFFIKEGVLEDVSLSSGHYKPTRENGVKLRDFLRHTSRLDTKADDLMIRSHH